MKECRFCKHANREGFFFCEDCGQPLAEDKPTTVLTTQKIDEEAYEWRTSYGTAEFKPGASILLRIVGTSTPLVLKPADQITIGRLDAEHNIRPDVDLMPYGLAPNPLRILSVVKSSLNEYLKFPALNIPVR